MINHGIPLSQHRRPTNPPSRLEYMLARAKQHYTPPDVTLATPPWASISKGDVGKNEANGDK